MEWTDKRMDDLATRIDDGFKEVKGDIARLDAKIDDRFGTLDAKIDDRFGTLDARIDDRFGTLDAKIDDRFETLDAKIDDRFGTLDAKIDALDEKFDAKFASQYKAMAGGTFAIFLAVLAPAIGRALGI